MIIRCFFLVLGVALAVGSIGCHNIGMSNISPEEAADFARVKPILESRCLPCHQGDFMGTDLPDFRTPTDLFDPDRRPPLVVPREPEKSRLIHVIYLDEDGGQAMPPVGHGLTVEQKDMIGEWIRRGAVWPDGQTLQAEALSDRRLKRR